MILNSPYISGSLTVTGNTTIQGQLTVTGSLSGTASLASNALLLQGTGSTGFATTSSLLQVSSSQQQISSSQQQISASLLNVIAIGATTGSNSFRANQSITGSLVVSSTITAQTLVVQTVTSSIVYSSGSNNFGNQLANTQTFTGSLNVTGSSHSIFGNVGIGTSSPNSYSGYTALTINNATTGTVLDLNRSGTRTGTFYADTSGVGIGSLTATNLDIFTGNSYIALQTCGLERLRITSAGCIGIGNTAPTYQLDMCSGTTVNQRIRLQRGSDDTNQNMLLGWNNIVLTRSNLPISSNQTDFSIIQCGCDGARTPFYVSVGGQSCFLCSVWIGSSGCCTQFGQDPSGGYIEHFGNTATKSVYRIQSSKSGDSTNYSQLVVDPYCGFAFRGLNGGNGCVGIGTLNPNTLFHIVQTGQPATPFGLYSSMTLQTDSQANYQRIRFDRDSCPFWGLGVEGAGASNDFILSGLIGGKTAGSWTDNVFRIKNSNGNVGIGTGSPLSKLEVQKTEAQTAGIFVNQCSADEATIRFKSTHSCLSDFRIGASILVSSAFEIYRVQGNISNFIINCNGFSKMSNNGTFVNGTQTMYHTMNNNTAGAPVLYTYHTDATGGGILSNVQACNTSVYSFRGYSDPYGEMGLIYSNGTFGSRTGTYGGIISDARCKTEICDASSQWSDIKNLRVRNFKLIEDVEKNPTNALRQIGFIAQEVETISPGLVFESSNVDVAGCWKNVKTSIIHTKAVKALQEAMCRIEILESCLGIS